VSMKVAERLIVKMSASSGPHIGVALLEALKDIQKVEGARIL
jgi:3-polyprenyl-4-hydroxybenzoate decarboxylase